MNQKTNAIKPFNFSQLPPLPRPPTKKARKNKNRPKPEQLDSNPTQTKSKKSSTGASFNDGFDVVNVDIKPKLRLEDFDEVVAVTVRGSVGFSALTIPTNPGLLAFFPRLAKFASLYERYRFIKLEFYFQHDVSQFNSQGQAGLVLLAYLFDGNSPVPTTKTQIEMNNPHVICMPNQNALLRVAARRLHPQNYPLFVRTGIKPGGADIKSYDCGQLILATQGMAGTGEVGELHCRGTVALYDEIVDGSLTSQITNFTFTSMFDSSSTTLTTNAAALLLSNPIVPDNGLGIVSNAGSIVLPAGNFSIEANVIFLFTGLATDTEFSILVDGVAVNFFQDTFTSGSLTRTNLAGSWYVRSNGSNAVSIQVKALFTTGTCTSSCDLLVATI